MKKLALFITLVLTQVFAVNAQESLPKLYNPDADAKTEIAEAVKKAGLEGKHVFLQIGGNWCVWCLRYNAFIYEDKEIDSLVKAEFVVVKVNYSKENRNTAILASLDYPQRFGFPVFVILDGKGKVLHIQDSALLEKDKGYDREKVKKFYMMWTATALIKSAQSNL